MIATNQLQVEAASAISAGNQQRGEVKAVLTSIGLNGDGQPVHALDLI